MTAARHGQRGQTTVELALCLPIVAFLLASVVWTGRLATDHLRLWHAAREAARVAVVDGDLRTIQKAATDALPGVDVRVEPDTTARVRGEPLTVSVTHHPALSVPLLGGLLPDVTMSATSTMRIERP